MHGGNELQKHLTAIKGTMNHAKISFSTEIFAGAITSVVQYLALLWFTEADPTVRAPHTIQSF
jgi:hypothetical protein